MTFELTDIEVQRAELFIKEQMKIDSALPAAGERWTYMITPTGLGRIIYIKDNHLDTEKDITDWDEF